MSETASAGSNPVDPIYPWSAVVGQTSLKHALLLCAIDRSIGGVLVQGPRGVAKTTVARALGELIRGPFVELPLGVTEERVTGSLDLDRALRDGQVAFAPGLLAGAHEGVLYVDEVNLLPDMIVDLLLDAAATGQHRVERDGLSHVHPARFVLIGTMNPEEGQLRPQLIDRFGLCVRAEAELTPDVRAEIITRRLDFDRDPIRFAARWQSAQRELIERCQAARERVVDIPLDSACLAHVTERCHAAGVEGVRADLSMLRAARANAAWHARSQITADDVDAVAEFALLHRRRAAREPGPNSGPSGASSPGPSGSTQFNSSEARRAANTTVGEDQPDRRPTHRDSRPTHAAAISSRLGTPRSERSSVRPPASAGRAPSDPSRAHAAGADGAAGALDARGAMRAVPVRAVPVATLPEWLVQSAGQKPDLARRGLARLAAERGARGALARSGSIDWFATLSRCRRPRQACDVRRRQRRSQARQLWIVALDCSASMLRGRALANAKGLAHALEARAVAAGAHLALISFRGEEARIELTSRPGRDAYAASVDRLTSGGGTPLSRALATAYRLAGDRRWRATQVAKHVLVVTDGRTRELGPEALARPNGLQMTVVDCERTGLRLGRASKIARALHARYVHIDQLTGDRTAATVSTH